MIYPLIVTRFVSCVVPIQEAYDFTWSKYVIDLVKTIVWLALMITITIFIIFGTVFEEANW